MEVKPTAKSFHHDVLKQREDSYEVNALESYPHGALVEPAI
jgi:hypothetical protein